MTNLGRYRKRTKLTRKVFSDTKRKKVLPLWRQIVEALLMLLVGGGIIYYLNWLPQRLYAKSILLTAFSNLISGLAQVISSVIAIGASVLIAAMALLSMVLILGGLFRVTKVALKVYKARKRS